MTNFGIMRVVGHLGIQNFRGVFMRDKLPSHPIIPECGIVNLDDEGDNPPGNAGTHWVAYFIDGTRKIYFDSYGLEPPVEVERYLKHFDEDPVLMQTQQLQGTDESICGHLCLYVLFHLYLNFDFKKIIKSLIK